MSLQASASAYREGILAFVWRQWGQLGLSADRSAPDAWCQDPEALLVFSLEVARAEPRMFDEILDWLAENGRSLMLHRVKHLLEHDAAIPRAVVEAALTRGQTGPQLVEEGMEPLFPMFAASAQEGPHDAVFLAHGLLRPPFSRSGKSRPVPFGSTSAFAFKLRGVFGASARSEALRAMLLRPEHRLGTTELAEAALLSRFGLQQALEELAAAGLVRKGARGKRDLVWWLDADHPLGWLQPATGLPTWVGWPSVYRGLALIWRWLLAPEREGESAYMLSSGARAVMREAAPLLMDQGLGWRASEPALAPGTAYWAVFQGDVDGLLAALLP